MPTETIKPNRRRYEELAQQAGCDETSDERFDRALAVLSQQRRKPSESDKPQSGFARPLVSAE